MRLNCNFDIQANIWHGIIALGFKKIYYDLQQFATYERRIVFIIVPEQFCVRSLQKQVKIGKFS